MSRTVAQQLLRDKKFSRLMVRTGDGIETMPIVGIREIGRSSILEVTKNGKVVALQLNADAELYPCDQGCYGISELGLFDSAVLIPTNRIPMGWPEECDRK